MARAAARAPRLALAEMVDRRRFNELLFRAYEGISSDRLLLLAGEAYRTVVRGALYPGARDLVRRCLDEGHDVVLVSGAPDFLMDRLASDLGATDVIANRLEMKDGYATGKLVRPIVAGPEKARLIREWAQARGQDLAECFAYSDSYSDVPMLSVVGHPCAVNPDLRLAKLAHTYAWPTIHLGRRPVTAGLWERLP
jgi:HAD superfamily hydrolase (TIGR01490 family)